MTDATPSAPHRHEARPTPASASSPPPHYDSRGLFGDARLVVIRHEGQDYRLRWTRNGKLILTK